ncbi:NAD(P)-binding protein [Irpex rosettiformis]|uniref:NAD(P)-binding protein n=1 Tax=Irpex rosettiformis TaxID=378272 RepID=A0ACB8TT30_9APHY|nr:NAD(P)-binding protein [Irpex rosettiformis]
MTIVTSGKVLITGVNGFLGTWVAKKLLEEGYAVRGTVRSEDKSVYLKKLYSNFGDKFESTVVPDITKDGAFDGAVKDVNAIIHLAAPFHMSAVDPAEIINPAVEGTNSVLQSTLTHGTRVRRFVLTSSVAAIMELLPEAPVFNEESWNEQSIRNCREQGKDAQQHDKYLASKTLSERAAWDFVEKNKDRIKFDLVVLNPAIVLGPILHEVADPMKLNMSMLEHYISVVAGARSDEELFAINNSWVDIRDVADAHALALQKQEAAGERLLIAAEPYVWQEWVNAAHAQDSSLPAGNPNADISKAVYQMKYSNEKAARILGSTKYKTKEETTRDILVSYREKGWLPVPQS